MMKIFVLANGRSGTKFLTDLFRHNVKNCICKHEPFPDMFGRPIYWYTKGEINKIRRLFYIKKLRIDHSFGKVYIETNHAFLKSFCDVAMEFFPDMKLIHLIRNPLKVAKSELNRHLVIDRVHLPFRYYKIGGKKYFRWALTGEEKIFQDIRHLNLTLYQKYVVQWIEIENRAMRFLDKYNKHKDCFTLSIPEDINNPSAIKDLFDFLGVKLKRKSICIKGRKNKTPGAKKTIVTEKDKAQFREVINSLPSEYLNIFKKEPYTRFSWSKLLQKSN